MAGRKAPATDRGLWNGRRLMARRTVYGFRSGRLSGAPACAVRNAKEKDDASTIPTCGHDMLFGARHGRGNFRPEGPGQRPDSTRLRSRVPRRPRHSVSQRPRRTRSESSCLSRKTSVTPSRISLWTSATDSGARPPRSATSASASPIRHGTDRLHGDHARRRSSSDHGHAAARRARQNHGNRNHRIF